MQVKEVIMSESKTTRKHVALANEITNNEKIRKRHVALSNEIIKNAYCIAGAIVAENGEWVNGEYIPLEHKILQDLAKKINQRIP